AHPKTVFLLGWLEGEPYSFLPREAGPDAGAEAGREPEAGPEAEGAQEAEAGPEAEGAGEAEGGPGGEAEAGPVEPASRFERWRRLFESPAEGRRARLEGDPERGASLLAAVRWVGEDLGVLEWPELGYLAWLERIACLHAQGGNAGKEAKKELGRFRDWWPRKRPPEARVSRVAAEVERFLEGSPAEKD
ncbi:MAG: hypothetical protein ACE5GW_14205, partial [Planctomycetota bacterium]